MQIEQLFQAYINSPKATIRLKQTTVSTYWRNFERYIRPFFQDAKRVDNALVSAFHCHLASFLSPKTTADVLGLLSEILSYSKIEVDIYKPVCYAPDIVIFSKREWKRLKEYCIAHLDFLTFGILLAMYSGIRPGELSAAQCRHIDVSCAIFKVRFTMQRIKNPDPSGPKTKVIIDTPKSKKSIRDIPLIDDLVLLARNLYQGIPPNAFLLTGEQGRFMEPRLLEDRYAKILEHLKIKGKNLYSIRHTFATTFYQKTHDVKSLSEILGHSDVKTTLNRYVHPCEDIKRQGINALLS